LSSKPESWYAKRVSERPSQASAFAARVLEQADALYNFARRLTHQASEAEDLVQDTFARAIQARDQFQEGTNLRAWLFRILRNAQLDALRRAQRSPLAKLADEEREAEDDSREFLRGDFEIDRLRRVVVADIENALASLSAEARSVILLDLEGFSELEIASIMSCAAGTVKSRLARARTTLRAKLAEYGK
jgi:RNA polymerase sigma-70 factor (ECF subfamily)